MPFTLHLARHLPTVPQATGLIDHERFARLLAHDADRTVLQGATVGPALLAAVARSDGLISSPLLRARQTVRVLEDALGKRAPTVDVWNELVEAGQPALSWPGVRMTQGAWSAASRVAWAFGWSADSESRLATEDRARRAAEHLEAFATSNEAVTVVAHGCFNVVLAQVLRRRGWQGPVVPDVRAAHFSTYRFGVGLRR